MVSRDVLYADDTLLVSQHTSNLQAMLEAVVDEGMRYGPETKWAKTLQIQIGPPAQVVQLSGENKMCMMIFTVGLRKKVAIILRLRIYWWHKVSNY